MVVRYKQYVPFVIMIILGVLSFFIIRPFIVAIIGGAFLAYLTSRPYKYLAKKTSRSTFSALLVCIVSFFLVVGPVITFVRLLVVETYSLFILFKQKFAIGLFTSCSNSFCRMLNDFSTNPAINSQLGDLIRASTSWVVSKGSSFLLSLPQMALTLFVSFIAMYYFLKDGHRFVDKIHVFLMSDRLKYGYVGKRFNEIVHGIVFGYGAVALLQGFLGWLGFYLFGLSSPLFWGVVIGLLGLIPVIGSSVVWAPAALFMIIEGVTTDSNLIIFKGIGLIIYFIVLVSSLDNTLKPKLMGEKAKIHPSVMLLGLLGGILFFGPIGILLGPVSLALLVVLVDAYIIEKPPNN